MPDFLIDNAHAKSVSDVFIETRSRSGGLKQEEASDRLRQQGPNQLPTSPPPRVFFVFARQFTNPLIYILLLVGMISLLIGHFSDAGFILGILLLNALIGTLQEYSAEKTSHALRQVAQSKSVVIRDGENLEVDSTELVIGDLILLESGNRIPADVRLIHSHALKIDESLLTGESIGVEKNAESTVQPDTPLGDRTTMAFAGTFVTRGRAQGIVTGTGLNSELGKIADIVLTSPTTKTPLILRMEKFTRNLGVFFSIAITLIGIVLILQGKTATDVLIFAAALGVAAIPEGLPVALTVALAVASRRMAKRNVIVRTLTSVEALGSCTFIGTDKTGTLTRNELTAKVITFPNQQPIEVPEGNFSLESNNPTLHHFLKSIVLCNEATLSRRDGEWHTHGDAVDCALLILAKKAGITSSQLSETYTEVTQIPYESENQFSATVHVDSLGNQFISVKGALEKMIALCDTVDRESIEKQGSVLASRGYKVLAVASGNPTLPVRGALDRSHLKHLKFLGLIGLIDPPRAGAREAIQCSKNAGVEVAMITGDHPITALAIARDLGLAENDTQVVTGTDLRNAKNQSEFDALVVRAKVFARVEPKQKFQITESLIRQGHYVAITGDGANDAPALKAAHVGIAIGRRGTDVAKETSDLIITDDQFFSIVSGIEEGRIAYSNIRKVIYLLISTGIAEIVLIFLSIISGMPAPLTAVQLLWLNLVSEGIQGVALAFEPKEGNEMKKAPRSPNEPIFNRLMLERVTLSAIAMGGISHLVHLSLSKSGMEPVAIQNHVLLLMVLFENVMVANARSETKSEFARNPFRNPLLVMGTLAAVGLHVGAMYAPAIRVLLGTAPISIKEWSLYLAFASSVFIIIELHKLIYSKRSASIGCRSEALRAG